MRSGLVRRAASLFAVLMTLALTASPAVASPVAADDTNAAPVVTATVSKANLEEPETVIASATFTDPESATETYTCSIDYGDKTPIVAGTVSGLTCTGPAHQYLVTASYAIQVTVTDSGGVSGAGQTGAHYLNDAPYLGGGVVLFVGPGVTKPAAGSVVYGAAPFWDYGSALYGTEIETYTCAFDYGDGSGVQAGTYVRIWSYDGYPTCIGPDHVYATAGTYTLSATVTDSGGASSSASRSNVIAPASGPLVTPPADQTISSAQSASYGGNYPYSLGSFVDPNGVAAGPWQWTVDWGNNYSWTGTATSQGPIVVSRPLLPGTYRAHITVRNSGGWSGGADFNVTVAGDMFVQTAPVVVATEGVSTTLEFKYFDPFGAGPWAIHIDWGDGSSDNLASSAMLQILTPKHVYHAADSTPSPGGTVYTATAAVTDALGHTGSASRLEPVADVAPVLTSAPITLPANFNDRVTLATFTDASVGPWHVVLDGGPGFQSDQWLVAPGPIQVPYEVRFGNRTFTVSVTDRGGLSSTAIVQVQIAPPLFGPVVVPSPLLEGQAFVASATFIALSPARCTVDFGDGTGTTFGSISGSTCSAYSYAYTDAGTYTLTFMITDARGATAIGHATVVVGNVPPVVANLVTGETPSAGSVVTAQANFSDPSTSETYSCTVNFGDGTTPQTGVVGDGDCTADHTYSQGGLYTVTMTVTDSQGGSGSASASVPVANLRPTVGATSVTGAFTENGVIQASASFTDPWSVSNGYICSIDYGDGSGWSSWVTPDQTCSGPIHFNNDAGTFTVTVEVDRGYGEVGTSKTTYTVANVAPVVSPDYVPTNGLSGVSWASSVTFADPGSFGSETYSCTFDFGDGGGAMAGVVSGNVCTAPEHSYASKGTYTMVATVADSNGGAGSYVATIGIINSTPIVGPVSAPASVNTGSAVSASATYVATDFESPDTCTVDYGDGTGPMSGAASGTVCTGPGHVYVVPGTFSISIQVAAWDGASTTASKSIVVIDTRPRVGPISVPAGVNEGASATASAAFTPAGARQTYKCTVDYGDGSGPLAGAVTGTTCKGPSHKFGQSGTFTVMVAVAGSLGAVGTNSRSITVANVKPTITSFTMSPTAAKPGSTVKVSLAFTDPGTSETYRAMIDWSDGGLTIVDLGSSARSLTASHVYAAAGLYPISVSLGDWTDWTTALAGVLAIYDPNRELSGSGSVPSDSGACQLSTKCGVASTATFSVSAKYARGASTPTVVLAYSAAAFSVRATGADWFVAADGTATIKGSATVNGISGYRFQAIAMDGSPDSLIFSVWSKAGALVYASGYSLKSGSITIR